MLFSRKEAVLQHLRHFQIHGIDYYDVVYLDQAEPDAQPQIARVPGEMIYSGARAGDRVLVEKIANTVMRIEKL